MRSRSNKVQRSAKHLAIALVVGLQLMPNPGFAAELVMFSRAGCYWCEEWHRLIGPIYPKTAEGARAPLKEIDISHPPPTLSLDAPVVFAPTFIVVENDKEVGRITGYPGDEFFWVLLDEILKKVTTQ